MEKDSRTLNKFEKQQRKEWNNVDKEQGKKKTKSIVEEKKKDPKRGNDLQKQVNQLKIQRYDLYKSR